MPASADAVFRAVTDIARLPTWNEAMTSVLHQRDQLDVGAEWVGKFRALGQTWRSRSIVEELDIPNRRLPYRSDTYDGNPSYARWTWEVTDDPGRKPRHSPHSHGPQPTPPSDTRPRIDNGLTGRVQPRLSGDTCEQGTPATIGQLGGKHLPQRWKEVTSLL